ncbi:dihydrofolate reductase [Kineobactrum salinum]|uniref:Dihydrofolate reductase n=1 Tax=Kineobactrum salinum TaxID=2708301 RepID=A0A6C0U108_9GAMM|nr:dihydrofolate reductase [Kineobactrum salinum]
MELAIMVAVAANGVIGRDNGLPWHLPEDLRYFKRVTLGKPVIMGRRTFESIGRPLPGRSNIVVSRDREFAPAGVAVVDSIAAALALAEQLAHNGEVVVIGGAAIYREVLPLAQRLYVTEVHASVDGDTRLPPVDWAKWRELRREEHGAESPNPFNYAFVVYERTDSGS